MCVCVCVCVYQYECISSLSRLNLLTHLSSYILLIPNYNFYLDIPVLFRFRNRRTTLKMISELSGNINVCGQHLH